MIACTHRVKTMILWSNDCPLTNAYYVQSLSHQFTFTPETFPAARLYSTRESSVQELRWEQGIILLTMGNRTSSAENDRASIFLCISFILPVNDTIRHNICQNWRCDPLGLESEQFDYPFTDEFQVSPIVPNTRWRWTKESGTKMWHFVPYAISATMLMIGDKNDTCAQCFQFFIAICMWTMRDRSLGKSRCMFHCCKITKSLW